MITIYYLFTKTFISFYFVNCYNFIKRKHEIYAVEINMHFVVYIHVYAIHTPYSGAPYEYTRTHVTLAPSPQPLVISSL